MNHSVTDSTSQFKKILSELKKYKSETKQLKQALNRLKTENKYQNELIDEKSKHMISCISENIALRKEIECLKKRLQLSQTLTKRKKNGTKHVSFYDQHEHEHEHEHKQRPYLIISEKLLKSVSTSSTSNTSNLSAQACTLSLPSANLVADDQKQRQKPTINTSTCNSCILLRPIAESGQYTLSPVTPNLIITNSNNNQNIDHEWGQNIAIISDDGSNADYNNDDDHEAMPEMDHLTLTLSFSSGTGTTLTTGGNTNLVYVDYSSQAEVELPLNFNINHIISEDTDDIPSAIKQRNVKECKDDDELTFPKAISVLSELTLTDVENDHMYISSLSNN